MSQGYQPQEAAGLMNNQYEQMQYQDQQGQQQHGGAGPGGMSNMHPGGGGGGGPGGMMGGRGGPGGGPGGMMGGPGGGMGGGGPGGMMGGPQQGGSQQDQYAPQQHGGMSNMHAGGGAPGAGGPPGMAPKTKGTLETIWFMTALCSIVVALICCFVELFSGFQIVDAVESLFLFGIGSAIAIVDNPMTQIQGLAVMQRSIRLYAAILDRVTGKGLVFVFLGCSLWAAAWTNVANPFFMIINMLFSFFVVLIGLVTIGLGVMFGQKLDKVKKKIKNERGADASWRDGVRNPQAGMTSEELKNVATNVGAPLEDIQLKAALRVLANDPMKQHISHDAFNAWIDGGFVML